MKFLTRASAIALAAAACLAVIGPAQADQNSPTGNAGIIAVDKIGAAILFIDPVSYATLKTIKTDRNPHEVAISPDHKTAYVSIYGPGVYGKNPTPGTQVLVVDLPSKTVRDVINVLPNKAPHGLMLTADGGTLYISCDMDKQLLKVDTKTLKIVDKIETEGTGHWVAITPDGSKAYTGNKYSVPYVTVLDLKTHKVIGRIPTPHGAEGIAVAPDGKHMAIAVGAEPSIMLVDTATDKILQNVPLENYPKTHADLSHLTRVRFSLDGKKLLTSYTPSGVISVMQVSNLKKQKQVIVPEGPMGFAFAPDGKTALVGAQDFGSIAILDISGEGKYVRDFPAGGGVETLAYY